MEGEELRHQVDRLFSTIAEVSGWHWLSEGSFPSIGCDGELVCSAIQVELECDDENRIDSILEVVQGRIRLLRGVRDIGAYSSGEQGTDPPDGHWRRFTILHERAKEPDSA